MVIRQRMGDLIFLNSDDIRQKEELNGVLAFKLAGEVQGIAIPKVHSDHAFQLHLCMCCVRGTSVTYFVCCHSTTL